MVDPLLWTMIEEDKGQRGNGGMSGYYLLHNSKWHSPIVTLYVPVNQVLGRVSDKQQKEFTPSTTN